MPMFNSQNIISKLMQMDSDARENVQINTTVKDVASKVLKSVEDDEVKLKVNKVWVDKKRDNTNVSDQKEVRLKGQIWGDALRADVELIDKTTGKTVDHVPNIKISNIPKITDRGTFLIGGNEYQFTKQSRLKPGVYTKRQANGEISSFFNVDKTVDFDRGFNNNFKINFNPEKKTFTMGYGSKNVPLYNALRAVGVSDKEMRDNWGKDVYEANAYAYAKHEVRDQNKLYEAIFGKLPEKDKNLNDIKKEIKVRLFDTKLDPDTTKVTLGKSYKSVDKGPLLDASKKIIDIHKGNVEGDDRESLIFKSFYGAEDHIREKVVKNASKIISNIKHKLKKNRSINKSMSSKTFDPFVVGTITNSQLSNPPSQTNIMSIIGEDSKMTVMGEGGIGTSNAVTNETRQMSNTEAGFLDPLHSPEGPGIGVTVHNSMGSARIGNDLYARFKSKSGKEMLLRPIDVYSKNISFPDQFDLVKGKMKPVSSKVKVINKGKMIEVPADKVDAIISSPLSMFDTSANSIPFLDSIQGNRGLTASKMQEQSVSLIERDKPLFKILDDKGRPLAETLASVMALPKSPISGEVVEINKDAIVIKNNKGEKKTVQMYNDFSLNSESFINNEPLVSVGDKVNKGQIIADNNFTKDGQMSLGTNLNVAYMPYKGFNYEDSAIMSESAAKKLTSQHMYDLKAKRSSTGVFSKGKFKAYYPEELDAKNSEKLDSLGVAKPGKLLERGDVVIAHMEKRSPTADDIVIGRLDKQLKRDMADSAVRWENDHVGEVTSVQKHGNQVVVNVKTKEPLKEADKISGLHGNKHIISKIVPDEEMPYNPATGERIDLTMSPLGVSNRINTSQLLESAAGKIGKKTGKQYPIKNFDRIDNSRKIMEDLKAAGLSDKDILINPETGKPFKNPIANGISHILKLEHKVDHKFSARYKDGYDSNEQAVTGGETGGKNLGRMEMAALLARGSNENLKEMFQIKGQRNDEYWRAMETGQSLPPPKDSFVWDKMLAMMAGSGINVEQKGKTFTLKPMTDEEILSRSQGELKRPYETYRKKDLAPMREGLFDPVKAGGIQGDYYTHFSLPEKILNPINAKATATLLDMPMTKLDSIINGKQFVDKATGNLVSPGTPNSVSGGPAVELLLSKIKVNEDLNQAQKIANMTTKAPELNKMNKKIRYLKALKKNKMKPTDYMISNVLVTPSKYRPMFSMGTEGTVIMSDINDLYQQTAYSADALKSLKNDLKSVVDNEDIQNLQLAESRGQLYQDVKAVAGLQEPTSYLHRVKDKKGYISQIDGGRKQTKEGFFQDKVLERRQDLVGRSTIILNPDLGGEQMGIPKDMATEIFQPFIMKKMISWGYKPMEAQKHIKDKTKIFERARQVVSDERMVIANRAPTLHRYNMTAFKPVLTDGKSVEVPSIVVSKNFGGDFDGDSGVTSTLIVLNVEKIAKNKDLIKCFDKDGNVDYFLSFIKERSVSMPHINKIPIEKGDRVIHIDLSEFPRIYESEKINEKGNIEYDVPEGISIITCNNDDKKIVKVPVTKFSIHPNLRPVITEFSDGNSLISSEDHSLVSLNTETWEIEKTKPFDIMGKAIPKIKNININGDLNSIKLFDYSISNRVSTIVKNEIELTRDIGHFMGMMIGDGWISSNQIIMASTYDELCESFSKSIDSMLEPTKNKDFKAPLGFTDNPHEFKGFKSFSRKAIKHSKSLTGNILNWIGSGAKNKHLPPFFLVANKKFRLGLLAGLLDTDGTVTWINKKTRVQFCAGYDTSSPRLVKEIVTLCRSLGVNCSVTPYRDCFRLNLSSVDLKKTDIRLIRKDKKEAFEKLKSQKDKDSSVIARLDMVPISLDLFNFMKTRLKFTNDDCKHALGGMKAGIKKGCMARVSAKKLIKSFGEGLPKKWIDIVNDENLTWVYAKSVKLGNGKVDMYDITAPGPYTFMIDSGIIIFDTFQIHTPISTKAIEEAKKMMPSASMLKTGYDSVLNMPEMDMAVGAWLASKGKGGKSTGLKFKNIDDARESFKNHKFTYGDKVTIGDKKATFGLHEMNSVVPNDSQRWDVELNKDEIENWIRDVTKSHNGKIAIGLADKIKDVGNNYVTDYGFTLGVSDTLADTKLRKELISEAKRKIGTSKDENRIISAYATAKDKGEKELKKMHGENTMVGIGIKSGGAKGIQNTTSISFMPGIVTDANDRPISIPITKSYSEGLDTSDYWSAGHGARGGSIKRSVSSFKPGWLTKDLMNSIYETRITGEDPVDTEGIEYKVSDSKAISNRYLAQDAKDTSGKIVARRNELVDGGAVNKLVQRGIKSIFVQSPLTDPTPGDGFSSYSYGTDYEGRRHNVGDNIGVISAHTITEPSLNLAMKAFHTGGALQKGAKSSGTVFDRLDRTLRFTRNIPDKATLSSMDGTVDSVKKSSIGGYDVILKNKDKEEVRYVDPNNKILVKPGQRVKSGDKLSTGTASPHDMLKYKGMRETQKHLVNEISDINDGRLDKRDIETIVRGITNTTRVLNSGDHPVLTPGDVTPLSSVQAWNKKGIGKEVKHEPFLTPTGIQAKAQSSEDWISRLAHNRIKRVLEEGTTMGWKSEVNPKTGHPIPGLISGVY